MDIKKIAKILYITLAFGIILVPAFTTNFKTNQVSKIDNTKLPEFPEEYDEYFTSYVENYLSSRLGCRTEMISSYQNVCYKTFNIMTHPLYIVGKNGQLYDDWDLNQYQRLEFDTNYIDDLSGLLKDAQTLSEKNNADFYFLYVPNKESIYYEDFPEGYTVFDNQSRSDYFVNKLTENEVNFLDVRDEFLKEKENIKLYNDKYDPGHWNAEGAFLSNKLFINNLICKKNPEVGELDESNYETSTIYLEYMPDSYLVTDEYSHWISLKSDSTIEDTTEFFADKVVDTTNYRHHYINPDGSDKPRILIMADSYFGSYECQNYYKPLSSELLFVHTYNQSNLPYYISFFKPDIVIFEACERAVDGADNQFSPEAVENGYEVLDDTLRRANIIPEDYNFPRMTNEILEEDAEYYSIKANVDSADIVGLEAIIDGEQYFAAYDKTTEEYTFTFPVKDIPNNAEITYNILTR